MIHRRRASVFQLRNTTSGTNRTSIALFRAMKNGTVGLISAESTAYVCGWLAQHRPEQEQIDPPPPPHAPATKTTRNKTSPGPKGREGPAMTNQKPPPAGNQRQKKPRQCTAHVAKRAERHDSAVEGEHERDQWSRNEIRAEFAGHLLYPPTCQ